MNKKKNMVSNFIRDKNKKSILQQAFEISKLCIINREIPITYFTRLMYRKEENQVTDYLSYKEMRYLQDSFFHTKLVDIFEDKVSFQNYFGNKQVPILQNLAYTTEDKIISYNEKTISFEDELQLSNILRKIAEENNIRELFLKPLSGINGKGCIVFDSLNNDVVPKNFVGKELVIQELIHQHNSISEIHPYSINTIRVNSINIRNEVYIISSLMRFGMNKQVVDNGGLFVHLKKNGTLEKKAYRLLENGGGSFLTHPETGVLFDGYKVPYYHEAIEYVKQAMTYCQDSFVGWDIAITNTGPVIIEANHNLHLGMADIAYGGLKKHEVIRDLLKSTN